MHCLDKVDDADDAGNRQPADTSKIGCMYRNLFDHIPGGDSGAGAELRSPLKSTFLCHAAIPKIFPTPAVSAIARAPQNVTRIAPRATAAPPTRAATPPRTARNTSEVPETKL